MPIRVTVWNEFRHEKKHEKIREIYPNGMHEAIGSHLRKEQ
jgi:trehalose utilization protein